MTTPVTIHDATIFSDLVQTELVNMPFDLDIVYQTTQSVFDELTLKEQRLFNSYLDTGQLLIRSISAEGIDALAQQLASDSQLCYQDLSAIRLAYESQSLLLTHIKLVRAKAKQQGLSVFTILWILDELYKYERITKALAYDCLSRLMKANRRFPDGECHNRLKTWSLRSTVS